MPTFESYQLCFVHIILEKCNHGIGINRKSPQNTDFRRVNELALGKNSSCLRFEMDYWVLLIKWLLLRLK